MMSQMEKQEKCIGTLDFTKDWQSWRSTLKEAITAARGIGVPDEEIKDIAVRLGDFLAEKICPTTKEEELIKEMWDAATPEERRVLANVMFKSLQE